MKKILLLLAALVGGATAFAQQEQQYSLYMQNPYALNPAEGGTEDFVDIRAGYRTQWVGLEGAPTTYYISGHGTVGKPYGQYHHYGEHKGWHGVGGYLYNDVTGAIQRSGAYASYSYNMPLTKNLRLSAGFFFGMKQFRLNTSFFKNISDGGDAYLESGANYDKLVPDASVGLWLYSKDYYIGLSSFQILNSSISIQDVYDNQQLPDTMSILNNHYFLTGGIKMPISEDITLIPSVVLKWARPVPIQADFSLKLDYHNQWFVGAAYRNFDSFTIFGGVVFAEQFEVSYAFDYTISALNPFNNGTHEVVVGYRLKHPKHPTCPSKHWKHRRF